MKLLRLLFVLPLITSTASAATNAAFDGGADSIFTAQRFGDPGGASVIATGGNPGGFLQLTPNVNGQNNFVTFDRTDAGTFPRLHFQFDFRVDMLGAGGADGFSFNFYNTANFGTTGGIGATAPFTPEDPSLAGVLGFGFDTWGNGAPFDANTNSADYSEITLFSGGTLIQRVDNTRALPVGAFNLKDGAWHTAFGTINFQGGTVSLNVDSTPIFDNVAVAGLTAFESRVGYAGRTGGANERVSIDNINVIPEPASVALLGMGGLLLLRRRRS